LAGGTHDFSILQAYAATGADATCQAAPLKVRGPPADNTKRSGESARTGIFRSFIMQYIYSIFASAVEVAICAIGAATMIYAVSAIG